MYWFWTAIITYITKSMDPSSRTRNWPPSVLNLRGLWQTQTRIILEPDSTQTVQISSWPPSWILLKEIFHAKITDTNMAIYISLIRDLTPRPSCTCTNVEDSQWISFDLGLWTQSLKTQHEIWHRCQTSVQNFMKIRLLLFQTSQRT